MYSTTWQTDRQTMSNWYSADGATNYLENVEAAGRDPLDLLIEAEEEETQCLEL